MSFKSSTPLIDVIQEFDMEQVLPLGVPTYESAAGNWTRPDNVWQSNNPLNLVISCNTKPSLQLLRADHLPIITALDLSIPHTTSFPTRNMRNTDFTTSTKSSMHDLKPTTRQHT